MRIPEVVIASYSLPPKLFLTGDANQVREYTEEIGADGLLLMPVNTKLSRQIIANHNEDAQRLPIAVVRQTYRGERNLGEVVAYLKDKSLSPGQKIRKLLIAAQTYMHMQHKDDSLENIERILSLRRRTDAMYEVTAAAVQSAENIDSRSSDYEQRRIVQITQDNIDMLIEGAPLTRQTLDEALRRNNFTHLSYQSISSEDFLAQDNNEHRTERLAAVAPFIAQFELTGSRSDLVGIENQSNDVERLAYFDTKEKIAIRELIQNGAQIQRIVYAVPGHKIRSTQVRKAIINNLREI